MINKRRPRISFNGFHKHHSATPVAGSDSLTDLISGPHSLTENVRETRVDRTGSVAPPLSRPFPLGTGLRLFMAALGLVALGVSIYLSYVALTTSKVIGCGGAVFDCSHVLNSRWSTVLGIPVALPAVGLYLGLLSAIVVSFVANRVWLRKLAMFALTFCAFAAAFAAAWFIFLQLFVVEHLCQYCLAAHTCGLLLATIILWKRPLGNKMTFGSTGLGFASVGILMTAQLVATPPPTFKIETYDAPAQTSNQDDDSELFDAPFASPVAPSIEKQAPKEEVFEAPGQNEVFEAPGQNDGAGFAKQTGRLQACSQRSASLKVQLASFLASMRGSSALVYQDGQAENAETQDQENAAKQDTEQKTETTEVKPPRIVSFFNDSLKLNAAHWPSIGKAEAKYVFVEMFDYTCIHCRETHASVRGAMDTMGDDLVVVMLPVPMNRACNPNVAADHAIHAESCQLSKLAVAVWRVDPSKFSEFHEWMFDGASAPSAVAAKSKAQELVDKESLDKELSGEVVDQYVSRHAELYKKVGAGAIPKLLFPRTSVIGKYTSVDGLVEMIKRESK